MNKLIPDESTLGLSTFKSIPAEGPRILQIPWRSVGIAVWGKVETRQSPIKP